MNEIANRPPQMIRYDAACKALAEARAVDEVRDVRSKADAVRVYAMQAKNRALEIDAAEIRIRAERRLGELLIEQKAGEGLNTGAKGIGKSAVADDDRTRVPTLADAGISKDLSSKAQKLAAIPADEFEAEVSDWRERIEAENQRVTVRLQQAGERAAPSAAPEPQNEPEGEPASEIEALRDELEQARDVAEDLAHEVETLRAAGTLADAEAEIRRLKAMLRAVEAERDSYRTKSTEMLVQIKAMQRKIERMERERTT